MQTGLELIGTDCANYRGDSDSTCVTYGRSPYAKYGADGVVRHANGTVVLTLKRRKAGDG